MHNKRLFAIAIVMIIILLTLTGCSSKLEGVYTANQSPYGVSVTMTFTDGIVQMNTLGFFTMNGVYSVKNNYVTIKLNLYGQEESITGKISGDKIIFADMTLEKL